MYAEQFFRGLALIAAAYAAVCAIGFARHRSLLYPAPPRQEPPSHAPLEWLRGHDGEGDTFALCAFSERADARTIVHFHGNGEQVAHLARFALSAREHGLSYCAVEYPGYGMLSHRTPTESQLYRAAQSVIEQLLARGVRQEHIVLSGQSLGTGVAVEMARRALGARLMLLSPYTSIVDVTQHIAKVIPASLIVRDRFDSASKAPSIAVPTLIVHGKEDTLIPIAMGRELARRFRHARIVECDGRGHNDLFAEGEPSVWSIMVAFAAEPSRSSHDRR
jgi:pimeloyl-ACP methyl ester carboxylesterase